MNNTSFNLSGKIDSHITEVLASLHRAAAALDIPLFVIGAFARDLLLEHYYNIKPARKTSDLDLGVKVAGWDDYERLIGCLSREENCSRIRKTHSEFISALCLLISCLLARYQMTSIIFSGLQSGHSE